MTARDSRGREYGVGERVAYNRSGDVVCGEVVHITPTVVLVRAQDDFHQAYRSPVSKVKNRRSILVIG